MKRNTEADFWANVKRGLEGECWEWTGARDKAGYGRFSFRQRWGTAHRLAYEFHRGEDPGDWHVCHSCDNPGCVNPHHLWLGTNADNIADKMAKGRYRNKGCPGETNSQAKLKEEDVIAILKSAETGGQLGKRYGVNPRVIHYIRNGKSWVHIPR